MLSGGYYETGSLVFTLSGPGGFSYTQTDTLSGKRHLHGQRHAAHHGHGGGHLHLVGQLRRRRQQQSAVDQGGTAEQTVVSPASPAILTTASGPITLGTTGPDPQRLGGGVGRLLRDRQHRLHAERTGRLSYRPRPIQSPARQRHLHRQHHAAHHGHVAGTYTWSVSYAGDGNNNTANDQGGTAEQVTIKDQVATYTSATHGFWQNSNGQAILGTYDTALGNWLATTYPNLFGNLNGATGTQVASYFANQVFQKAPAPSTRQ